jgi:protease-4
MDSSLPPAGASDAIISAQLVGEPRPVLRRRPLWRVLTPILVGLLLFCGLPLGVLFILSGSGFSLDPDNRAIERHHSLERYASHKVAIIRIEGPILDGEGFVKDQIDRVRDDEDVKAVVVRVSSPGGTVAGSDYMYHHLNKLRQERSLPMVVSMGDMAASGGYYVSMAVGDTPESIFAEPTTWTGSIGVIIPHYNVAGLMEKWQIESDSVASHRLKGMGSMTKRMTEEERTIFQSLVDEMFDRFKEIVKSGRPKFRSDPSALDAIATGQVFTTKQALANGLVDKEGFIEEAIVRAIVLAKLDKSDVEVIEYLQPLTLESLVFGAARSQQPGLAELLELATPKAYYLCTLLPGVALER